ncbi:GSCOCG00001700001-RA-CDS [Cotesia congregata]|uniref:Similar to CG12163: Putative cysteine proteinase CG12163 (Drosophila melanogaster) n=1 Tax=Cotesia congregata TaxID=51543 RepID=A0A8J2HN97_COTCN|nr:GSCOCG00001700001-RA-CDS [Cotesia congregata]CAG5107057.1 Similar to CG12163: Putative cysteine proteinase CG12163 (Drosophila melanogaster) [Cotesia congregata]
MAGSSIMLDCKKLIILLFCSIFVVNVIATTPINVSPQSISDLLVQSALNSLNEDSPTRHTYKSGNVINSQKLVQPPYTIYRLTLNLETDCHDSSCPREVCAIDIKQHEVGVIEVESNSKQCMYLYPQLKQNINQVSSNSMQDIQEQEIVENLDKQVVNDSVKLDHEDQEVLDQNDKPFIAMRASHYCPGCPYELNPTLPGLAAFGELAADSLDQSSRDDYKYRVVRIVRVTRSVPPGSDVVRYELLLEMGQTNCRKTEDNLRSECSLQINQPTILCAVMIDERPWLTNSRRLIRNNCTETRDQMNNLNGNGNAQPHLAGESLTSNGPIQQQGEDVNQDRVKNLADELLVVPISTSESGSNNEEESKLTEPPFTRTVLKKDDTLKKLVKGFTDKFREFDEFLKDFDIPEKTTKQSEPSVNGPEVIEEIIRPEKIETDITSESQEPNVKISRKKRSLNSEPNLVKSLAQMAVDYLDEVDTDDKKRVVVKVIDSKEEEKTKTNKNLHSIIVMVGTTNCLEERQDDLEECIIKSDKPLKICKIHMITENDNPLKNAKVLDVQCFDKKEQRFKRDQDHILGGVSSTSTDDLQIQEFVQKGLKKYSSGYKGTKEPVVAEIVSASQQVVAGTLYNITVRFGESDCFKGEVAKTCLLTDNSPIEECFITVWSRPWLKENPEEIKVKCGEEKSREKRNLKGANYSAKMLKLAQELKKDQATESVEPENKNQEKRSLKGSNYSSKMMKMVQDLKDERAFESFQKKYQRVYTSEKEKAARFKIFKINMKVAETLQEYEQGTALYGPTMFADMTTDEFRSYTGLRSDLRSENQIPFPMAKIPDIELPNEYDWRHYNVVTPVKDQGQCGSCWAFSVTGNVEGQYAIKHSKLLSLSEQELVDCDKLDDGCNGGLQENAYRALEELGGLELEDDYPYDAEDEKCHFKKNKAAVEIVSAVNITSNETQMAQWLVKNGPMAIGINANAMQFYMGGISHPFKFLCSHDNLDHGVLIVGYGVHTYPLFKRVMPFWIVKNSWGTGWGEQGYYRVYRGDGTCGLNTDVSSAIVA